MIMYRKLARLVLLSAIALLLPLAGCKKAKKAIHQAASSEPDYTAAIHSDIDTGHLAELRWPDFHDIAPQVAAFYESRDYDLAWSSSGKPTKQAAALMEAFSNSRRRGLDPDDYDAPKWQARVAGLTSEQGAALFDTAMTVNAMRFLSDLHMGRVNPSHFAFGVKIDAKKLDLPDILKSQIVEAGDVAEAVSALEPTNDNYKALEAALPHYLDLAAQDHTEPLPAVEKSMPLTRSYAGYAALQAKLSLYSDLAENEADLVAALKHFQHRHNLTEDGKLTPQTVAALNVPASVRVRQIADALERWRWLSDDYQKANIIVNLPEFELRAYESGNEVFRMRTVNGQGKEEEHHTPMIADHMKYLVFRPFWNVPVSIAKKDLIPHLEKNANYLSEKNYEAVNGQGQEQPVDLHRIEQGSIMVREKPGIGNSLGLVKFMFPNQFNVYLHDTNQKYLFDRQRRDYSHGCVRVQDPPKLAAWLLRDNPKWDEETIHNAMSDDGDDNKAVGLSHPLPIVIFYGTAWVDDGEVHFFNDVYGYDRSLEDTLAKGRPYPAKPIKIASEASV